MPALMHLVLNILLDVYHNYFGCLNVLLIGEIHYPTGPCAEFRYMQQYYYFVHRKIAKYWLLSCSTPEQLLDKTQVDWLLTLAPPDWIVNGRKMVPGQVMQHTWKVSKTVVLKYPHTHFLGEGMYMIFARFSYIYIIFGLDSYTAMVVKWCQQDFQC